MPRPIPLVEPVTSGHAGSNESRLHHPTGGFLVITMQGGNDAECILESKVIVDEVSLQDCDSPVMHELSFNVLRELQQQMSSLDGFRVKV